MSTCDDLVSVVSALVLFYLSAKCHKHIHVVFF